MAIFIGMDGGWGWARFLSITTAAVQPVQVGSMSATGTSSITNVGSSSMWKPIEVEVRIIAIISKPSSRKNHPSGPKNNWTLSVTAATAKANQMRFLVNSDTRNQRAILSLIFMSPHCIAM